MTGNQVKRWSLTENELKQLQEFINQFDQTAKDDDKTAKPSSFPRDEDEEVQVRPSRPHVPERPKTFTSPPISKRDEPLNFRGCFGLEIGRERCVKVVRSDHLRLTNDQLEILDEHGLAKVETKRLKSVKTISKKEIEMSDAEKIIYRFKFTTVRETKHFLAEVESKLRSPPAKDKSSFFRLVKLLKKRSSRDLLESKGIYRNEPIFGNTLRELCDVSRPIPEVVTRIVTILELPENITSEGLYRQSANMATVQHIRCEINCGHWEVLEKYRKEVDVLAGSLKLFFRELKEPLISSEVSQRLVESIDKKSGDTNELDGIINSLPQANRETLLYIIKHLLKVCSHKSENKMDVNNIAICWGPSLISFPENCTDLVAQTAKFKKITAQLLDYYQTRFDMSMLESAAESTVDRSDFTYQVVQKLIEMIERNIDAEGLYKKSGSSGKIDKLMKILDTRNLDELDRTKCDIYDLCCALKKFVGSLSRPLIPSELLDDFCNKCDKLDESELKDEIRKTINSVPGKSVLLLLFRHLRNVVKNSVRNKMTVNVVTDMWMAPLVNKNVQQNKPKILKLFQVLLSMDDFVLPDVLLEAQRTRELSRYENVDDDIIDISSDTTKL